MQLNFRMSLTSSAKLQLQESVNLKSKGGLMQANTAWRSEHSTDYERVYHSHPDHRARTVTTPPPSTHARIT